MLIEFTVENFRSFESEATLSLRATPITERKDENVFSALSKIKLLKNAVVYGANASGKSNLFMAIHFVKSFMRKSHAKTEGTGNIKVDSFKLNSETENSPSKFQIIFIHENVQYRYGFTVDEKQVHSEWLYYVPNKQEVKVFTRNKQEFELTGHFKSEERLVTEKRIRPNALFLSVSAQWNGDIANKIIEWVKNLNCISSLNSIPKRISFQMAEGEKGLNKILKLLQKADIGIEDFRLRKTKVDINDLPLPVRELIKSKNINESIVQVDIETCHKKFNRKKECIGTEYFNFDDQESDGTKKFFELSGLIIDALQKGKVLFIDELDSSLHPNLVNAICELFNSFEFNPLNAQLVFSSHNTNLLGYGILRRDQVWFTEKDNYGATNLYSLAEYRKKTGEKIRKDASFEKDYLKGEYGAVPNIDNLGELFGR